MWEQNLCVLQTVQGMHSALSGFLFGWFYVKLSRREAWPLWRLIVAFIVYSFILTMLPGTFIYLVIVINLLQHVADTFVLL